MTTQRMQSWGPSHESNTGPSEKVVQTRSYEEIVASLLEGAAAGTTDALENLTDMTAQASEYVANRVSDTAKGLSTPYRSTWSIKFYLLLLDVRTCANCTPHDLDVLRALTDAASLAARVLVPLDVRTKEVEANGVRSVWMWPASFATPADAPAQLLYVHGGAFCLGSPETHMQLTCQIAKRANVAVLSPAYRRCPEAAITDAHEDVIAVYKYMAEGGGALVDRKSGSSREEQEGNKKPTPPTKVAPTNSPKSPTNAAQPKIVIGGESAGANIALAVALKIRHGRVLLPQAAGLALMSPWADLKDAIERERASWAENENNDFVLAGLAKLFATWVLGAQECGGAPASDKDKFESLDKEALLRIASSEDVSPALAKDLSGLPPTLVTTGSCETLRDSQLALVERLREAGVKVQDELYQDMPHAVGLANFAASSKCSAPIDVVDRCARFVDECCGIPYHPPKKSGCCCTLQ